MDLEVHIIWNANRKPCFADNLSIKSALCGLLLSRYARFDPIWASFCLKYAECEYFWKIGLCHLCSLIVPWLHAKNRKILTRGSVPICSGYVYGKSTENRPPWQDGFFEILAKRLVLEAYIIWNTHKKPCLPVHLSIKPARTDQPFSRYEIWPPNAFAIAQKEVSTFKKLKNLDHLTSKWHAVSWKSC